MGETFEHRASHPGRGVARATAHTSREASGASPAKVSDSVGGDERRRAVVASTREGFDRVDGRSKGNADRRVRFSSFGEIVLIGNFRLTRGGQVRRRRFDSSRHAEEERKESTGC